MQADQPNEPAAGRRLRVLVLSADVGESHALTARILGTELNRHPDVEAVSISNDFSVLGPVLDRVLSRGFRFHLGKVKWSYNVAYRLFTRLTPARLAGEWALYALGAGALEAAVRRQRADVVVSTYPVMNPVLARLRAAGRINCPAAAVIGPLGGHEFWVQPGLDLHMTLYREAVEPARRLAHGARVEPIRPLVRPEFFSPADRAVARAALGIEAEIPLVVISGGGWGAGDLTGAVEACLSLPQVRVIALTGRNEAARQALHARYATEQRVTVLGFTERIRELMWAADAFVTATAGLSCNEAALCGCPVVTYGFAVGHVRDNTTALAECGLVRRAGTATQLRDAVRMTLADGRRPIPPVSDLPSAADLVVALAPPATGAARATTGPVPAAAVAGE